MLRNCLLKLCTMLVSCMYLCNGLPVLALQETAIQTGNCGKNAVWHFEDGMLTIRGEGDVFCTDGAWDDIKTQISTVIVEDGITALGCMSDLPSVSSNMLGYCFGGCTNLQTVQLPDSLRHIGTGVFEECTALETINFPSALESLGDECFYHCIGITDVSLPSTLRQLGANCFGACDALSTVLLSDALEELPEGCFSGCTSLQSIAIPDSVTKLGDFCFSSCSSLREIMLPKGISVLPAYCFSYCTSLETVNTQAKNIGDNCFADCSVLTNLPAIQSFRSVGTAAFRHTPYIEAQGDYVVIGNNLYHVSKRVCAAKIPDGVLEIQADAFEDAASLVSVAFPETMAALDFSLFTSCRQLLEMTIPASVVEISGKPRTALQCIYGKPHSAGEEFANRNQIPFKDMEETASGYDMRIDFAHDVWHFSNSADVFGETYYLTEHDLNLVKQQILPDGLYEALYDDTLWSGSCFGMSLSVLLAKNRLLPMTELSQLQPTPEIISLINYYQSIYRSSDFVHALESKRGTASQKFYSMLQQLKNVPFGESPMLLLYATATGSHAVVAYDVEAGEWEFQEKQYNGRILIWDSNTPTAFTDSACLYFDDTSFEWYIPLYDISNQGSTGLIGCINDPDALDVYPYPFSAAYENGDVNCDGAITMADALLLQKALLNGEKLSCYAKPDLNDDGEVDARDLTLLKRRLMAV